MKHFVVLGTFERLQCNERFSKGNKIYKLVIEVNENVQFKIACITSKLLAHQPELFVFSEIHE